MHVGFKASAAESGSKGETLYIFLGENTVTAVCIDFVYSLICADNHTFGVGNGHRKNRLGLISGVFVNFGIES